MEHKITIPHIMSMKNKTKITMITAYDYITSRLAEESGIDIVLIGDSMANVIYGHDTTLKMDMNDLIRHSSIVAKHTKTPLLVGDMPFGSFHVNIDQTVENAIKLIKYGNVESVKIEGGSPSRLRIIEKLIDSSIPVMGHIGLTPQSVHSFGGLSVQGRSQKDAQMIFDQAKDLEKSGVYAIVLEGIPESLSKLITESINIPTIGIGAGVNCDGQVLVIHDLLGFTDKPVPKFVKKYENLWEKSLSAIKTYIREVKDSDFPSKDYAYQSKKIDIDRIK